MGLDRTDEQAMLRDTCRQFGREEFLAKSGELDERAEFPREQVAPMAELGLLGEEGESFVIAMRALDSGRIGIAAHALGIARSVLGAAK